MHEGQPLGPTPRLLEATPAQLVAHLAHPNGWWRDTAQKLLVLAQDMSVVPALQTMARTHPQPLARFHALWTLEGLGALDADLVREKFRDPVPSVRVAAIRTGETLIKAGEKTLPRAILALVTDAEPAVAIQAMMTAQLLKFPEAKSLIQKTAVTATSRGVKEIGTQLLNPLSAQIAAGYGGTQKARLERGQQIYMELCFACHGVDGRGTPVDGKDATLAPPLAGSATVQGHRDATLNAVLFGVAGPVAGRTYEAQMTPMGANDDEWLAAVVSYIRTGFGNGASPVDPQDVARVRSTQAGRTEPWTLDALRSLHPQPLANRALWKFTSNRAKNADADNPAPFATGPVKLTLTVEAGQTTDAWLRIELPAPALLSAIRLGSSKSPRNYIRRCRVELSDNGTDWRPPAATGTGTSPILELTFPPTRATFVRITHTDPAKNLTWTLDDVTLFTPAAATRSAAPP